MEPAAHQSVSIEDFETIRMLGRGEYGKVLLVRKKASGELFALKILKKKLISEKNQIQHTKAERSILQRADHPFIVRLRYAFHSSLKLYLALEYCPGGELYFHINQQKTFPEARAKFYAACIVLALDYLHSLNIIYRDLKPENIVIDSEGYPKITDFGLAKENISFRDMTKTVCGTPEYIAPEIILRQGHGQAVDWWSLGCIIYEMLIGLPPFYLEERREIYRNIIQKQVKFTAPINPVARDLITKLLKKEPSQRLGTNGGTEIMRHEWFREINWNELYARRAKSEFAQDVNLLDPRYFSEENSIAESPNYDTGIAFSPTYNGYSYSAGSGSLSMHLDCEDLPL